ncbi:MAG: thermonuclease family protein [Parvularculaceae bacterium]
MGNRGEKIAFRPRRRAFSSRPRALLSAGGWGLMLAGAAFGAAVGGHWAGKSPQDAITLVQPPAALPEPVAEAPPERALRAAAAAVPAAFVDEPAVLPTASSAAAGTATPDRLTGRALRIIDGDTFTLDGVEARIRLWGVDAPERREPGFDEAAAALEALVADRILSCEELDRDRYQRIVARCTLDDGRDIGAVMIEGGAAIEMLRYSGGYYGG